MQHYRQLGRKYLTSCLKNCDGTALKVRVHAWKLRPNQSTQTSLRSSCSAFTQHGSTYGDKYMIMTLVSIGLLNFKKSLSEDCLLNVLSDVPKYTVVQGNRLNSLKKGLEVK